MLKHVTYKSHCSHCQHVVYTKSFVIEVLVPGLQQRLIENALKALVPSINSCYRCGCETINNTYSFINHKQVETKTINSSVEIERCKEQIAATYNHNSDMPLKDRLEVREILQEQLQQLLHHQELNTILKTKNITS